MKVGPGLGQNFLEPLVQRVPIFFGPHARRWESLTRALREAWPALAIESADDLVRGIVALEESPEVFEALRARADALVGHGHDVAAAHVAAVQSLLAGRPAP